LSLSYASLRITNGELWLDVALPQQPVITGSSFDGANLIFTGTNGNDPETGLIVGVGGNFYGTTRHGGGFGAGTVFKFTTNATLTTLYTFTNCNPGGCEPIMLIQGRDTNLYGMANGGNYIGAYSINGGMLYQVGPDGVFGTVHAFSYPAEGAPTAACRPVQATDGNFYGVAGMGGSNFNAENQYGQTVSCGMVYRMRLDQRHDGDRRPERPRSLAGAWPAGWFRAQRHALQGRIHRQRHTGKPFVLRFGRNLQHIAAGFGKSVA
jgi:uncharacterized repeat protein (TIGR03803 family)